MDNTNNSPDQNQNSSDRLQNNVQSRSPKPPSISRRALLMAVTAGTTSLAGCNFGQNGTPQTVTNTSQKATEGETPTSTPDVTQTPAAVQAAIANAHEAYAASLEAINQSGVIEMRDNLYIMGFVTEDGFQPFLHMDEMSVLGPTLEASARLEELQPKVSGTTAKQVKLLIALAGFITVKWREYDYLVQAFNLTRGAYRAYLNGRPRSGVYPARLAIEYLKEVSERRKLLSSVLSELSKKEVSPEFIGWDPDTEVATQKFIEQIIHEFTPVFKGTRELNEAAVVTISAMEAINNENYADALTFSIGARRRYIDSTRYFNMAINRDIRHLKSLFIHTRCIADDHSKATQTLIDACRAYRNDEMQKGDRLFEQFQQEFAETSCGARASATPTDTPNPQ